MKHALSLDFVISFCRDQIPGHGEDSFCYSFCDSAGLLGTFDGCGGAGARKHDYYSGHTEAYIASRICAGVFYDYFRELFPCKCSAEKLAAQVFAPNALQRLVDCMPPRNNSGIAIKGSSVRTLPTTVAVALMQQERGDSIEVSAIWAGDSRVYVLTPEGLMQLTEDDSSVPDPMITIYEDGILNNLMCADKPSKLHCKTITMNEPFIVFSATDGCFGYLSTPMEFEGALLSTLLENQCAADWETGLADVISSVAGDDHALCLAAYGFGSYAALQKSFVKRYEFLRDQYLLPVSVLPLEDLDSRIRLWNSYRGNYMKLIKDGLT